MRKIVADIVWLITLPFGAVGFLGALVYGSVMAGASSASGFWKWLYKDVL